MPDTPPDHRPIRSFVLREGRLTEGQRKAFERLWPRYGVDYAGGRLRPSGLFGNDHPLYLEIGFGNGEALAETAARHPDHNYLGIEVHRPGVGRLLLRLEASGLRNVRIIRHDAMEILRHGLPDESLDGVMLFFPDPWHKKRHHKRRMVQPEFAALLAPLLKPGGVLHMATDWEDYARQMMTVMSAAAGFENCIGEGQFAPRPQQRPLTKFEQRGRRLGHGVWDLCFRRI
ncbi:MAG TPA: tRNA (guanosine(46)-N7)-methyltransferase TrmB [Sedimenticola sp.]|nr:tRNA (guanosine(46)-N7)-methyltransferase TrmB [Sedimenticola sp.]